ncbi:MAG: isoquinoline 1-oxidoreductase [Verrucomicrobia bacterium]|nr:MAG: isoquinoline 1-oxidoreductase [Verrucomicrobiota bacterium]
MRDDSSPIASGTCASGAVDVDYDEIVERVAYDFGVSRRSFVGLLGAGLLVAASLPAAAQERGRRSRASGARNIGARIHLGVDGTITVLSGKVEGGQGARTELSQAAAEELGVPVSRVQMILCITSAVPDDGGTYGSGTSPRTVPAVRQAAAAVRGLLISYAAKQWQIESASIQVRDGKAMDPDGKRSIAYADLAKSDEGVKLLQTAIPQDVQLIPVKEWKTLGTAVLRPDRRDIVTGAHKFPSDISRPGMLYGKVMRPPAFGARLESVDLAPAKAMKDVVVVGGDQFVGVAASNTAIAEKALEAVAPTAKWVSTTHNISSNLLYDYLQENVRNPLPPNPFASDSKTDSDGKPAAATSLRRTYHVPYIQHAPLEPRVAVAEWNGDKLTVWTATQNPFGVRNELAGAFHLPLENISVAVPDFGAGFGGKHTGECAVEAARLAKEAGKPVSLRWSREEEFTWAYFRPAAVIQVEATLDAGKIATWHFININSGQSAMESPYAITKKKSDYVASIPPLRHGSYRALAATANNFARETFMDELAALAGKDPLEFRLAHLDNSRLRAVLEKAAAEFKWKSRAAEKNAKNSNVGFGLACGTEKGSYVAACAEVALDPKNQKIKVTRVSQAFECGAILNPANLLSQVQGAIIMGLGAVLREETQFEDGQITNASFKKYQVPRFDDVPELDVHLINRPDLSSAGAGETPLIAIAPAVANAVFQATGKSVTALPIRVGGA